MVKTFPPGKNNKRIVPTTVILAAGILPLVAAAFYTCFILYLDLSAYTLQRRETIAYLAGVTVKEKLDRVVDVGVSLATRVQLRELVKAGKWDAAIGVLERVPKNFPYIDTVALFDPAGTIWAVAPPIPEIIGKSFAYRDYYQGVSKNWTPYVSEAFKRAVEPYYNVVSVAIPIQTDPAVDSEPKVLGILLLTIKLDTLVEWSRNIDVGPGGFLYIVDRTGHLVAHPTLSSQQDLVDYSSVRSVHNVLQGERGVEVVFNAIENEERVSAYAPVLGYGWGVVAVQPTRTAFTERNKAVLEMAIIWAFILVAVAAFMYRLLRDRSLIRAQRDREQTFLESIGDGVFAIDRSFTITLWNKAASWLCGFVQAEALGKPMRDIVKFVHESDGKENITFIEEAMLFGEARAMEDNTLLVRKDGKKLFVGDSASPIFDDFGKVAGAIVVFRDVTKERELEKAKEEFVSITTHQLRTPVGGIRGYLELLLGSGGQLTKEQRGLVDSAFEITKRLGELVNALLNVTRIDSGALGITPQLVDPVEIYREVIKELVPLIAGRKQHLELLAEPPSQTWQADPQLLRAILQNLISNAVKYSPEGGQITVRMALTAVDWRLEVADTGFGIPASQQGRVFEKFFRADNIRSLPAEGTGLGLYIVKAVVEQAGGDISFTSTEGKGTTFTVTFPANGMKQKAGVKTLG